MIVSHYILSSIHVCGTNTAISDSAIDKIYGVLVPRVSWQSGWSIYKHGSINPVGIVEDGNDDFYLYS